MMESFDTLLNVLKTILGVGGLILVHELGHFLVGRWCGVKADVFSIGFGRALLKWKPGETEYRLALLPLGGYVKFAGEFDTDPRDALPGEFNAASYPRKAAIMLAGVVMNFLTAIVLFAAAFGMGVETPAPVVGEVAVGGTAWEHGLEVGDRFVTIEGTTVHGFEDIPQQVAVAESVHVVLERGGETIELDLPTTETEGGIRRIGVGYPLHPDGELAVEENSPAWKAGLRTGDRLAGVDGRPTTDWRVAQELQQTANRTLTWTISRDGADVDVELPFQGETAWAIGVQLDSAEVTAVRRNSPAWEAGIRAGDAPVRVGEQPTPAVVAAATAIRESDATTLVVRRAEREVEIELPADSATREAFAAGIFGRPGTSLLVSPNVPSGATTSPAADAGLLAGSTLLAIDGKEMTKFDELKQAVAKAEGQELELRWRGPDGTETTALVQPAEFEIWDVAALGVNPLPYVETFRAEGIGEALGLGLQRTGAFASQIVQTLGSMLSGGVSPTQLSGPIAIAKISFARAEQGVAALFLFLGFISMNLAVLNLLPIPILDGGRLVELTIEEVRGEPLSPRVKEWIAITGLVLVVGLMVFVVGNDLLKL